MPSPNERRVIFDISPAISPGLAVWPGDTPPSREVLMEITRGESVTLSTLRATVHLGAHADAPSHYGQDAPSIEARDLGLYLGKCQVVSVATRAGGGIVASEIHVPIVAERVLIRTGSFPDPNVFSKDFTALTPGLIRWLAERDVRLVGVDTPSVDPFSSKGLEVHHEILKHDMAILEGLVLDDIPDDVYELIALPLKLVGFDASPVRAILRTLNIDTGESA